MPRKGAKIPHRVSPVGGAPTSANTRDSRRRRARERLAVARTERQRRMTPSEAVALYRAEKASALARWAAQGGPSCGFTSGRHPIIRSHER